MNFSTRNTKVIAFALTAVMALGTVAPALAGNGNGKGRGHGKKWRRGEVSEARSYGGWNVRREYDGGRRSARYSGDGYARSYHRGSSAGPVFAGIIGGIAIGAILANRAHSHEPYQYDHDDVYYVDPYCHKRYASLSVYAGSGHHHPRHLRVYDRDSDRCLRTIGYDDGQWDDYGAGYGGYSDSYYEDYEKETTIERTYERRTVRQG